MNYIIGIGTNIGFTLDNICKAIGFIGKLDNIKIISKASLYSSKALLKDSSPQEWDIIYLNTAIQIQTNSKPLELLSQLKNIEQKNRQEFKFPSLVTKID